MRKIASFSSTVSLLDTERGTRYGLAIGRVPFAGNKTLLELFLRALGGWDAFLRHRMDDRNLNLDRKVWTSRTWPVPRLRRCNST